MTLKPRLLVCSLAVLAVATSAGLASQHEIKPGKARWPIKTSLSANADTREAAFFGFARGILSTETIEIRAPKPPSTDATPASRQARSRQSREESQTWHRGRGDRKLAAARLEDGLPSSLWECSPLRTTRP